MTKSRNTILFAALGLIGFVPSWSKEHTFINISLKKNDGALYEGDTIELECSVTSSSSAPIVIWYKNGDPVDMVNLDYVDSTTEGLVSNTKYKLRIWNAQKGDGGLYTCQGQVKDIKKRADVFVSVFNGIEGRKEGSSTSPSPYVKMWTQSRLEVDRAQAITLLCRVQAQAQAQGVNIYWDIVPDSGEKVRVNEETKNHKVLPSGDLLVTNVDSFLHGANGYECTVSNRDGFDSVDIMLILIKDE